MIQPSHAATLSCTTCSSLVALLLAVAGAEPPAEEPIELAPVRVVTDPYVEDEAAPSTVVDRRAMQEDAVSDLPAVLDEQPGLRASRLGGLGSFSAVSVRGSTPEQVAVYLDGVPLDGPDGVPVDLSGLPLGPLDTVVVYRGVSPMAFGRSAIGGVVSLHTRADLGRRLEVEGGGGSFGTRKARALFASGDREGSVLAALDYLGSQGDFGFTQDQGTLLSSASEQDDRRVERRNNAFDRVTALAKGSLDLATWARARVVDLLTWRRQGLPGLGVHPTERASFASARNLLGIRLELDGPAALPLRTAVSPFLSWSSSRLSDPLGEVGLGSGESDDHSLVPGATLVTRLPIPLDDEMSFVLRPTLLADLRHERFEPGGARAGRPSRRTLLAAGAELLLSADPVDLELVLSCRYESIHNSLAEQAEATGRSRFTGDEGWSGALTWRAALLQASLPSTTLKLNVARSVRFPSLFELFGNTGTILGSPGLEPEEGMTADLGFVHSATWLPRGNHLSLEGNLFWQSMDRLIEMVQNAQGTAVAQNLGAAHIAGAELGAYADVLRLLRLRGSLTWMHSEDRSEVRARRGKSLPKRPEWKTFARAEIYGRGIWVFSELGASFEVEHLSGSVLDPANLVEVPARVILGAGVWTEVLDGELRAALDLHNLSSNQVQDLAGYPLPGLTALASVRWVPVAQE